jgi:hypothetical protein
MSSKLNPGGPVAGVVPSGADNPHAETKAMPNLERTVSLNEIESLAHAQIRQEFLESMAIEKSGTRLFINMTGNEEIGVVDREKRILIATGPLPRPNKTFRWRLMKPVINYLSLHAYPPRSLFSIRKTGKVVASVPTAGLADDLAYDAAHQRLYAACGEGFITVTEQREADDHTLGNITTQGKERHSGAGTESVLPFCSTTREPRGKSTRLQSVVGSCREIVKVYTPRLLAATSQTNRGAD